MREEKLDRDATRKFAYDQYRALKRYGGEAYYVHPQRVGNMAEQLMYRHFQRTSRMDPLALPGRVQLIDEAWHAGWLHDVIEMGEATYDDIVDVTNLRVADWVAALTEDNRKPTPIRLRIYLCELANACDEVKIVKLADLCDNLQDMLQLVAKQPTKTKKYVGDWPDAILRTLEAISRIRLVSFPEEFEWCERAANCLARCVRKPDQTRAIVSALPVSPIQYRPKK